MTEEVQEQSQEPVSNEAPSQEAQPTLADVAKKYDLDREVQNFTAQPPAQAAQPQYPASPPFTPPDPISSPDQWNQYQANLLMQNQQLTGNLRELSQQVESIKQQAQQAKLDSEVNKAVSKVNEKLKIDPVYAEIALEKRYRDDPIFKRIWDNRSINPKALDEALGVITNELQGVFSVRQDPQLAENVRAAKQSQKTSSTTTAPSSEEEAAMKLGPVEFDRWWNQRKRGLI